MRLHPALSSLALMVACLPRPASAAAPAWPQDPFGLAKYAQANAELPPPAPGEARVVFMGDSITELWGKFGFFPDRPYVNRGISGQTTPQMLVRFRADVVDLHPKAVVILGGTNDIAGNTGPETLEEIENNLASMAELARAHGIAVVLCSVLPVYDYPWRPGLEPARKIQALDAWIRAYALRTGGVYVDYFTPMVDARLGLRSEYTGDGVHPNAAGYAVMAPLAEAGIAEALGRAP